MVNKLFHLNPPLIVFQTYVTKDEEKPYWNRKSRKTINTFALMGLSKRIYALEADSKGSRHDSTVFMESVLYQLFNNGWRPFEGSYVAGDSAYRVSFFIHHIHSGSVF